MTSKKVITFLRKRGWKSYWQKGGIVVLCKGGKVLVFKSDRPWLDDALIKRIRKVTGVRIK
jgi:predicted RNA binding protein YcfA (HicA-like mRNA interferase family)